MMEHSSHEEENITKDVRNLLDWQNEKKKKRIDNKIKDKKKTF